ncbi:MAG: membrane dipeptidase [Acidobacteria bacterium]|nr:membrane dipeptidase [Acidobacteriota bacterium]
MAQKEKIGIGIIGTGFARSTQIPGFRACAGVHVSAIASGQRENAERVAREFEIPFATGNWREIVARDDVDLVSIVTPPSTHAEMTLAALDAGKAVLCEKPMALNAVETERMRRRAAEANLLALVDHELRFLPARRRMREMILAGELGRVRHAKFLFRADSRANVARVWDWWSDREAGGGVLGAIGSHAVDTLHWLLGTRVSHVSATLATHVSERHDKQAGGMRRVTTDDEAALLLNFADSDATQGATGVVALSVVEPGEPKHCVEVFGSEGALKIEGSGELFRARVGAGAWETVETASAPLAGAPYEASAQARSLHAKLLVADMHADSLLWDRDLLVRGTRGHVDVPRLVEGNVALQIFTVVTKTPRGLNIERNDDRSDNVTLLAVAERWPVAAWGSLKERALYQAWKLRDVEARSGGNFVIVKTASDLSRFLERRQREPRLVAGVLGVEGAHALDGDLSNLDALYDAGVRMMAPTHFFDNEWGGSAHGTDKIGLTEKGRELIRRMEARHMLVDVAHASVRTLDDVLGVATRPVLDSHTGVRGTCDNARNLSDDQLNRIAATGGVIGIGYWDTATCGTDARAVARAIRYAVNIAGVEHVALGSDFDGAVTEPFDTTGLVEVTDALLAEGFNDEEIRRIMGGNVMRVLSENLPQ